MSILKILVRTIILFVCSIFQMTGVVAEGITRLSAACSEHLSILDDKVRKGTAKKHKTKAKALPT